METSNESTGEPWNDLPLFAADTRASLSAKQVVAKVKKILATCGLGFETPLAHYDPTTQSWKMSEAIYPSEELAFLPILPPSGMTRNGALFLQPAWEPITGAIESSSWPTPTAVTRPMEGNVRLYRAKIEAGEMTEQEAEAILGKSVWEAQGKLPDMWPTPTTQENEHPGAVWTANNRRVAPNGSTHGMNVADAVQKWPTPTANDSKNPYARVREFSHSVMLGEAVLNLDQSTVGGKLNPTWVEWLMGFPLGWTDLEDLETQ